VCNTFWTIPRPHLLQYILKLCRLRVLVDTIQRIWLGSNWINSNSTSCLFRQDHNTTRFSLPAPWVPRNSSDYGMTEDWTCNKLPETLQYPTTNPDMSVKWSSYKIIRFDEEMVKQNTLQATWTRIIYSRDRQTKHSHVLQYSVNNPCYSATLNCLLLRRYHTVWRQFSFTHFKDMLWVPRFTNRLSDPDQAPFGGCWSFKS